MKTEVVYLIARSDHSVRVGKRYPSLRHDEVAFRVDINFPNAGGRVIGGWNSPAASLDFPDVVAESISVEAPILPASDDGS